jgi:hypothetical protein
MMMIRSGFKTFFNIKNIPIFTSFFDLTRPIMGGTSHAEMFQSGNVWYYNAQHMGIFIYVTV